MVNAAQAEYPAQRFFLLFFQVVSLDMYAFLQQWDMAVIMLQIVAIDLLLGGDNAVVIAMACRKLPPQKRTKAIIIGTVGAILARVLLLAIALYLLSLPWLKIVGALLLLWIGIKLVRNEEEESEVSSSGSLWRTAITITVADVIMSLDNVLAVAAAGKGHIALVALGVARMLQRIRMHRRDDGKAVIDEQMAANSGARMNVDRGHPARKMIDEAREEKQPRFEQPVRDAVHAHRDQSGVE